MHGMQALFMESHVEQARARLFATAILSNLLLCHEGFLVIAV